MPPIATQWAQKTESIALDVIATLSTWGYIVNMYLNLHIPLYGKTLLWLDKVNP